MKYTAAKATQLGLLEGVRLPIVGKPCLQCGEMFREDGVAGSCLSRFGNVESIDFCNPCMVGVLGAPMPGADLFGKEQTTVWLQEVAKRLQRIPSQSFPSIEEFREADREERRCIVALCQRRPSAARVKELFGSWLAALIAAHLLENGTRRLLLGTQCGGEIRKAARMVHAAATLQPYGPAVLVRQHQPAVDLLVRRGHARF
jgi:hypothetical protein